MTTRPLPDHGTYARANGSPGFRPGCKCDDCAPVLSAAKKRQALNSRLGRRARVNAAPAREWLQVIRPTMSWQSLTEATDLEWHTLQLILTGQRKEISHHTLRKILATQPASEPDPGMYIDATGSVRRIRAMQVAGHSYRTIAEAAHTADSRLQKIATGEQPTVRYMLAKKIEAAYRELAYTPAPAGRASSNTRNRAAAKGWLGADFWDDVDRIDDPNFDPATVLADTPRYVRLAEDALWLQEQGYTRQQIGERLGEDPDYVTASIKRYRKAQSAAEQVAA